MFACLFPGTWSDLEPLTAEDVANLSGLDAVESDVKRAIGRPLSALLSPASGWCRDSPVLAPASLYVLNALHWYLRPVQQVAFIAGFGIGEYNALLAAGVFDFGTGLRLVLRRAELARTGDAKTFAAFVRGFSFAPTALPVVSSVTGRPYPTGNPTLTVRGVLTKHFDAATLEDSSLKYLRRCGVTTFREVGRGTPSVAMGSPAGALIDSAPKARTIALDDLEEPRFTNEARDVLRMAETGAAQLRLEPEMLCEAAESSTGLRHWGDSEFRTRLDVLCRALNEEAGLSEMGRFASFRSIQRALASRLLLEDLVRREPAIEQVPINRPIIIAGMPRTGTTHLVNLLAVLPTLQHVPYWLSLEPFLSEQESRDGPDPRIARCADELAISDKLLPHLKMMHEMTVDHVHEDTELMALDIAGMAFELPAMVPTWGRHYSEHSQAASYVYLKRVLQALTWTRGMGAVRWLLKAPQHLEQLPILHEVFPDATFVITHRDPVAVVSSLTTMLAYIARARTARPNPRRIGSYWAERTRGLLTACVRDHGSLPEVQTVDVRFSDLVADPMTVMRRILAAAELPFGAAERDAAMDFIKRSPRNRHGSVRYDLAALGLDADSIRVESQAYAARFGVWAEG